MYMQSLQKRNVLALAAVKQAVNNHNATCCASVT
jgi:hypothetical protein